MTKKIDREKKALKLFETALEHPKEKRVDWVKAQIKDDAILLQSVLRLIEEDSQLNASLRTGLAGEELLSDLTMPEKVGAYKITQVIGHGGMGSVFLGERDAGDFEHVTAIKLIRAKIPSQKLVENFAFERQTLAALSHPNIAKLFDGGTLENGMPYIIMEYVKGVPITKWSEDNALSIQDRLHLFQTACQAISYAHQNQIIHRDITPSNVLVTPDGVVKLIDFGIAQTSEPDSSLSETESSYTPGYAAPEQIKGTGTNALSDIYSLGRLLEALTKNDTNAELNAIINKAKNENVEARYQSVEALITDIGSYLSGYPISAYATTNRYKFSKFFSRHKIGSSLAFLSAAALILAFATTFYQYRVAEAARLEADQRFQDVRDLANTLMFDVHDEVYRIPGAVPATKLIVDTSKSYLDDLAADQNAPTDLIIDKALGYIRLGLVTGSPKGGSLNDMSAAEDYFEQAEKTLLELYKQDEDNKNINAALGKLYFHLAELSVQPKRDFDLASKQLEKSLSYFETAIKQAPDNFELAAENLRASAYRAEVLMGQNAYEDAEILLKEQIENVSSYLKTAPKNENLIRLSSGIKRELAAVLSHLKRNEEAILALDDSLGDLKSLEEIIHLDDDRFALRAYGFVHWRRGFANAQLMNDEAALKDYNLAIDYAQKRIDKDPFDADALRMENIILGERATVFGRLRRFDRGLEDLRKVQYNYEKEFEKDPDNSSHLRTLFVHHYIIAGFHKSAGNEVDMCQSFDTLFNYFEMMKKNNTLSKSDEAAKPFIESEFETCL